MTTVKKHDDISASKHYAQPKTCYRITYKILETLRKKTLHTHAACGKNAGTGGGATAGV